MTFDKWTSKHLKHSETTYARDKDYFTLQLSYTQHSDTDLVSLNSQPPTPLLFTTFILGS